MLVIISTHPIQYQVPLWRKLAEENIDFEVWYLTDHGTKDSYDREFGKKFSWDIPTLNGYKFQFLNVNKGAAPNKGFRGLVLKENLKKKLKENRVTHVYINGWQVMAYWQALWQAKQAGIKTIFKGESNDLKPEVLWKWPIKKLWLSAFFRKIDYFLYIGEANRRLYKKYGVNDSKLLPGLYCIDNERFYNTAREYRIKKNSFRTEWGIPEDSFCILFSGKFIPKKRPIDIVKAVDLIKSEFKIHILFVGDGELYDEIKTCSQVIYDKNKGIVDLVQKEKVNVSIVGFLNQTEIPKAYAVADCLVLPSNFLETWGLVVNEAMATGLPAIVSNECGSAEDLIAPIDPKLVFASGDIYSLAKSIKHLINNPPETKVILDRIKHYSYASTIDSLTEILKK